MNKALVMAARKSVIKPGRGNDSDSNQTSPFNADWAAQKPSNDTLQLPIDILDYVNGIWKWAHVCTINTSTPCWNGNEHITNHAHSILALIIHMKLVLWQQVLP